MQEAIDLTGVKSQQYTKKPQQDVGAFLMDVITLCTTKLKSIQPKPLSSIFDD